MACVPEAIYRRLPWIFIYFTGVWIGYTSSHVHTRSADSDEWKSFVTEYGKEYPSLNNRWTVDAFVRRPNPTGFREVETEFEKLNLDAAVLIQQFDEIRPNGTSAYDTVNEIDNYLNRWKALMYLMQRIYDVRSNGTLPIDKMKRTATERMKILFSEAYQDLPGLLVLMNRHIVGEGSQGRKSILCHFVMRKIHEMSSAYQNPISLKRAVNESGEFLKQLMKVQVRGALLYDMTCQPQDIRCRQRIVTLERDLQTQSSTLESCTPMLLTELAKHPSVHVYLVKPLSSEILYIVESNMLSSRKGHLDLSDSEHRGSALKCAEKLRTRREPSTWTLEDATPHGRLGYFIRGMDNCYVGFDRTFLKIIQRGMNDPSAAGAENDEVLLCRSDAIPNRQTQTFTIEAMAATNTSGYKLRNVLTGKYLRVIQTNVLLTDEDTGGHVVNLVLQPCDREQIGCLWGVTKEVPECIARPAESYMDMFILKLYVLLMGVLFIMLVASLVVVFLYRKQIRRDYLHYKRVNTQDVIIPPSYRFPNRT